MNPKKSVRVRRAAKTRRKIRELKVPRLCVHRTPRHIYAQLIAADGAHVLAQASTLDKEVVNVVSNTGNVDAAKIVGGVIAKRVLEAGVKSVAFDRSGFKYHGRVKALADAAREAGLEF
jgi:large subunit ribosomal protein L18